MKDPYQQHGAFSWFELMTGDVEGAKDFYSKLFGWTTESVNMDDGMTYTVVKVNGDEVGGIMAIPPQAGQMPSMWGIYITVDDVDATAGKVREMGGNVLMGPQDIAGVGRFCVLQDPAGAVISAITYKTD